MQRKLSEAVYPGYRVGCLNSDGEERRKVRPWYFVQKSGGLGSGIDESERICGGKVPFEGTLEQGRMTGKNRPEMFGWFKLRFGQNGKGGLAGGIFAAFSGYPEGADRGRRKPAVCREPR